jgi:hypothetical protein
MKCLLLPLTTEGPPSSQEQQGGAAGPFGCHLSLCPVPPGPQPYCSLPPSVLSSNYQLPSPSNPACFTDENTFQETLAFSCSHSAQRSASLVLFGVPTVASGPSLLSPKKMQYPHLATHEKQEAHGKHTNKNPSHPRWNVPHLNHESMSRKPCKRKQPLRDQSAQSTRSVMCLGSVVCSLSPFPFVSILPGVLEISELGLRLAFLSSSLLPSLA